MGWAQAIPIVGSVVGAIAGKEQAEAANRPQTVHTDQTETQTQTVTPNQGIYDAGQHALGMLLDTFGGPPRQLPQFHAPQTSGATNNILQQLMGFEAPVAGSDAALTGFLNSALGSGNQAQDLALGALGGVGGNRDATRDLMLSFLGGDGLFGASQGGGGNSGGLVVSSVPGGSGRVGGGGGAASGQLQFFFDDARLDPANDPTLQPILDAIRLEAEEDRAAALQPLIEAAEAGGRFGSGAFGSAIAGAEEEIAEATNQAIAQLLGGFGQAGLDRRLAAAQSLGDLQNAAQARAASSAAAAGAYANQQAALDLERELGLRGQNLQLLSMLQGGDQSDMALLGQLSADQNAFLLGAGNLGLGQGQLALGQGQLGLDALGQAGGIASNIDANRMRAAQAAYQSQLRQFDQQGRDIAALIQGIGALSSPNISGHNAQTHSTLTGTNVQQGQQMSSGAAALQGGLSGALSGIGLANMFSGGGGGGGGYGMVGGDLLQGGSWI